MNALVGLLIIVVLLGMVFLHRQLAAIHELVNSNLTKAQSDLALADARIRVLEEHIADEPRPARRKKPPAS